MRLAPLFLLALALMGFGGGASDPFILPDNNGNIGSLNGTYYNGTSFRDTSGKTLVPGPYAAPTCTLVSWGQSNEMGEAPTAYTPAHANVYNFNPYDSAVYQAADPLLGASTFLPGSGGGYGSYLGRLADALITSTSCKSVILVPTAIGGSKIADWARGILAGRLAAAIQRLLSRGITPTAILGGQGEADCTNGTATNDYQSSYLSLIASVRATGWQGPIFVAQQTYANGAGCPRIAQAQANLISPTLNIWPGPNNDAFGNSFRYDTTHFSDAGNATARVPAWLGALHAYGTPF